MKILNVISRVLGSVLGLLAIAFLTVLLIAPRSVADALLRLEDVLLIVRVGIVLVLYVLALLYLYTRLRFTPRANSDMLHVRTSGAIASLTVDSVRERILKAVSAVPGVSEVSAQLKSLGGNADIELQITTASDQINIPEKQREISHAIEQVIKKQLGIALAGRPRITMKLGSETVIAPVTPTKLGSEMVIAPVTPAPVKSEPLAENRGFFGRSQISEPTENDPDNTLNSESEA